MKKILTGSILALTTVLTSVSFAQNSDQKAITAQDLNSKQAILARIHKLQKQDAPLVKEMEKINSKLGKIKTKINALENQRELFA